MKRTSQEVITIRRNIVNAINVLKNQHENVSIDMIGAYLNDYFGGKDYNPYNLSNGLRFLREIGAVEFYEVGKERFFKVINDNYEDPLKSRVLLYFPQRLHDKAREVSKKTHKSINDVLANWMIMGSEL